MEQILNTVEILKDIFVENPLGQTVGFIAFLISIYNFAFCKDRKFLIVIIIASFVWGIHFLLLGLLSASIVNFVDVVKNGLALKFKKSMKITSVFMVFYVLIGIFTYDGLISLIPPLTGIASTFLVFFVRGIWLNIGFLGIISLWFCYNVIGQSLGGLSSDIALMFSGIFGIIRIMQEEKKQKRIEIEKELAKDIKKEVEMI